MSISSTIKLIRKLEQKKYRRQTGLFVAEGRKIVQELINSPIKIHTILATENAIENIRLSAGTEVIITDKDTIAKASRLKTPQQIIAIAEQRQWQITGKEAERDLVLALDNIQDPGNMGTIIRLADWFGISLVLASVDTVDIYNSKVVQASMGSIIRTPVVYTRLDEYLSGCNAPVYGTLLDGQPIDTERLTRNGVIVMGNEAHGIRPEIRKLISHRLLIPSYRQGTHAESLNVAMATSIVLWEFRRRW